MKKNALVIMLISLITLIFIAACNGNQKKDDFLTPYLTQENKSFSILILSENDRFFEQTKVLEDIYKENMTSISKAGVIKKDSKEGDRLKEDLKINTYPSYILLDNKKVLIISENIEQFKTESKQIIEEIVNK